MFSIIDLERQLILSKDNITVNIDTIVYYRVVEVFKSAYRVKMIVEAIKEITYAVINFYYIDFTISLWRTYITRYYWE